MGRALVPPLNQAPWIWLLLFEPTTAKPVRCNNQPKKDFFRDWLMGEVTAFVNVDPVTHTPLAIDRWNHTIGRSDYVDFEGD